MANGDARQACNADIDVTNTYIHTYIHTCVHAHKLSQRATHLLRHGRTEDVALFRRKQLVREQSWTAFDEHRETAIANSDATPSFASVDQMEIIVPFANVCVRT